MMTSQFQNQFCKLRIWFCPIKPTFLEILENYLCRCKFLCLLWIWNNGLVSWTVSGWAGRPYSRLITYGQRNFGQSSHTMNLSESQQWVCMSQCWHVKKAGALAESLRTMAGWSLHSLMWPDTTWSQLMSDWEIIGSRIVLAIGWTDHHHVAWERELRGHSFIEYNV